MNDAAAPPQPTGRSIMCRVVSIGLSCAKSQELDGSASLRTDTFSFHSSRPAKGIVSPSW